MRSLSARIAALAAAVSVCSVQGAVFASDTANSAAGGWFDVTLYGATPDVHTDDDAPAFRAAYAAAAVNGGTVYVPSGVYLVTSLESWNSHITLAAGRSVTFQGDAPQAANLADWPNATHGSVILTQSASLTVFTIAIKQYQNVHTVSFKDLSIKRELDPQSEDQVANTAHAIYFRNIGGYGDMSHTYMSQISHVGITGHYHGIYANGLDASGGNAALGAVVKNLLVSHCRIRGNVGDGIHLDAWGEVTIADSVIDSNDRGIVINGRYDGNPSDGEILFGTLRLIGLGVHNSVRQGALIYASTLNDASYNHDIHITGCQFDRNGYEGLKIKHTENVNIAACSFSGNGVDQESAALGDGMLLEEVRSTSVAGCTFEVNRQRGLLLRNVDGVSVSGCTFQGNDMIEDNPNGEFPALTIDGGQYISLGSCAFVKERRGGQPGAGFNFNFQDWAIELRNNPLSFNLTGITVSGDTSTIISGTNLLSSFGSIEFIKDGRCASSNWASGPNTRRVAFFPEDAPYLPYVTIP